jgi:pyruvate formate lyase activating enzyme
MTPITRITDEKIQCVLCPHLCRIAPERSGLCGARKNKGGKIELASYGGVSGYSVDPIEKKPLYHWFPGYKILSVGSYGCNMRCDFCQNFHISQGVPERIRRRLTTETIITDALSIGNNIGIAFTYNEPVIWFEFMRDIAVAAKNKGLHTAMVSNGYVCEEPLAEIIEFIDAFNIDLKAFNNDFYKKIAGATLEPVKSSLKQIAKSGRHLEITTLIIPGQNDSISEMIQEAEWIAGELGTHVPLHLSRYFPMHKSTNVMTTGETLLRMYDAAKEKLDYVYLGNMHSQTGQNTHCPECGTIVTARSGYNTGLLNLNNEGCCENCGRLIYKNLRPSLPKER